MSTIKLLRAFLKLIVYFNIYNKNQVILMFVKNTEKDSLEKNRQKLVISKLSEHMNAKIKGTLKLQNC